MYLQRTTIFLNIINKCILYELESLKYLLIIFFKPLKRALFDIVFVDILSMLGRRASHKAAKGLGYQA